MRQFFVSVLLESITQPMIYDEDTTPSILVRTPLSWWHPLRLQLVLIPFGMLLLLVYFTQMCNMWEGNLAIIVSGEWNSFGYDGWVWVPDRSFGRHQARLPKIGFLPDSDEFAFGFLGPSLVLRGCHLIPAFEDGRTTELLTHH